MIKAVAVLAGLLGGCADLAYYAQAVGGHLEMMGAARPIDTLVGDPAVTPALKKQLEQAKAVRDFACSELGLPDNGSYRSYADLSRPYVVWNVFAAPEFSLKPARWCNWVTGCVSYRGYFDRTEAEKLAAELREQGFDAYVGGVPAYSTLGYFDDPVLNTFLRFGAGEVARIVFHELAHQMVYVKGDTAFNESFATAVENEGLRRWFARNADPAAAQAFALQQARKAQFTQLVTHYRDRLRDLYAKELAPEAARGAKREAFAELKGAYAELKASWGGYAGYDKWFEHDLNNAKLASLALYLKFVPAFEALLKEEGGDLPRFYARVEALSKLAPLERVAMLNAALPAAQQVAALAAVE